MDKTEIEARHYDERIPKRIGYDLTKRNKQIDTMKLILNRAHKFFEEKLINILKKKRKGVFLDFGCGAGNKTLKFVDKHWKLEGIDISSKSIELAKKIASERNLNASYYVMDCENMDFPDSYFDVIVDY